MGPTAGDRALDDWIERLRGLGGGSPSRRGSVEHADAAARLRGARAVRLGHSVSLARVLDDERYGSPERYSLRERFDQQGRLTLGFDEVAAVPHGIGHTHLDGLNHYGVDGAFYGDVAAADAAAAAVDVWGAEGIVTRGVLLDVAGARGTDWVEVGAPVTAEDLDAALERAQVRLEPGDGILVDMGRDRFERAGHAYRTTTEVLGDGRPRPGMGPTAAEWIARQRVSVVCWDFLDAAGGPEPRASVHLLIWAIGLALVDNCDFGAARRALREEGRADGLLVVAPLRQPRATASLVNPVLVV